jgi:hypothetical protein
MSKVDAIHYVVEHLIGTIESLRNKIGNDRVLEFAYLGYIVNGMSSIDLTYHATESLRRDYEIFYKKPSCWNIFVSILFGSLSKVFA